MFNSPLNRISPLSPKRSGVGATYSLATALHEWYRPSATDVGTTVTQLDTGIVGGLNLANPDVASEPTVNSNTLGYDGVAQWLRGAHSSFRSGDNSGVIHCKFKATDNTLNKVNVLWSSSRELTTIIHINIDYRNLKPRFVFRNDATIFVLEVNAAVTFNSVNTLTVWSDGATNKVALNGVVVAATVTSGTNTGKWFNDTTAALQNIILGGRDVVGVIDYGKSDQYGVWYEPYTSDAAALANGLDIQNNAT